MDLAVLGLQLHSMVLRVFYNLNGSMTLLPILFKITLRVWRCVGAAEVVGTWTGVVILMGGDHRMSRGQWQTWLLPWVGTGRGGAALCCLSSLSIRLCHAAWTPVSRCRHSSRGACRQLLCRAACLALPLSNCAAVGFQANILSV